MQWRFLRRVWPPVVSTAAKLTPCEIAAAQTAARCDAEGNNDQKENPDQKEKARQMPGFS
jgi:hypothetical protein